MVLLMAATILAIAAGFLPSAAQAHPGHHHAAAETRGAEPRVDVLTHGRFDKLHIVPTSSVVPPVDDVSLSQTFLRVSPVSRSCDGTCCGASAVCCPPAVTFEAVLTRPPRGGGTLISWPDSLAPSGVDLEALPKPPPSFA